MIEHDGTWLPSVTVGLWFLGVLAAICVISIVICVIMSIADGEHDQWILGSMAMLGLLGVGIGSAFGYWPFHDDYHRLQPASGVVQSVDSRFLAASQYVVATYDTGLTVRCDDSRCATVRPGESLRLLCTKEHQFGSPLGADGWGCRWNEQ